MWPVCTNVWVRDLGNYRYPVEKIGKCPTQYGKEAPRFSQIKTSKSVGVAVVNAHKTAYIILYLDYNAHILTSRLQCFPVMYRVMNIFVILYICINNTYLLLIFLKVDLYFIIIPSNLCYDERNRNMFNQPKYLCVLAQETLGEYKVIGTSFIMASYIKFVEAGGARAALIKVGQPKSYYEKMIKHINGVLLPGGNVPISNSTYYTRAIQTLFNLAKGLNDKGDYFPIWGTCLGFQNLMVWYSDYSILSNCEAEDVAMPLKFKPGKFKSTPIVKHSRLRCTAVKIQGAATVFTDYTVSVDGELQGFSEKQFAWFLIFSFGYRKSKMFGELDDELNHIFTTENVTVNFHHDGIRPVDFKKHSLGNDLRILSTNTDIHGVEFISSIEAFKYPFYGVQFHPEKNLFVWVFNEERQHIPHSYNSVRASQYLANFLVDEARKSHHSFKTVKEEEEVLSFNYPVTNTVGILQTANQVYAFQDPLN
ncbi:Gamma-glutamyl hydrolase A [Nymphon striatum]|nr:Gamma-glutamyl hydrolase A [Nymphon striatum]